MKNVPVDLLILGGGIAGLWTLLRAQQAGYSALLLESRALGGVQSIASQGIIHGGTKYALGGGLSEAARAIGRMPERWRACLQGGGELDLSAVRQLSPHQYLWASGGLVSSLAGFFAGKLMRSRVTPLTLDALPPPFDVPQFDGSLYRLEEPVLDTASLMQVLAQQGMARCWRYRPEDLEVAERQIRLGAITIEAQRILLAAGAGNEALLQQWGRPAPVMQRRPLQMVMVRGVLPAVYAHALGASANPRLTITSYPLADGRMLWYLGGDLAEQGVAREASQQIEAAKGELKDLLPWLDTSKCEWATFSIDRAELATPGGSRPDDAFVGGSDGLLTTWPTKLAFAPRVADLVLAELQESGAGNAAGTPEMPLEKPPLAPLPWEMQRWS